MGMPAPHFPGDTSPPSEGAADGSGRVAAAAAAADDSPTAMPLTIATPAPPQVRCECEACGAHVLVAASWQIAGWCANCGGYALRALDAPAPPPVAPVAALDASWPAVVPLAQARAA